MLINLFLNYDLSFQKAATPVMEGILDLHHTVFFFIIIIFTFVMSALLYLINKHQLYYQIFIFFYLIIYIYCLYHLYFLTSDVVFFELQGPLFYYFKLLKNKTESIFVQRCYFSVHVSKKCEVSLLKEMPDGTTKVAGIHKIDANNHIYSVITDKSAVMQEENLINNRDTSGKIHPLVYVEDHNKHSVNGSLDKTEILMGVNATHSSVVKGENTYPITSSSFVYNSGSIFISKEFVQKKEGPEDQKIVELEITLNTVQKKEEIMDLHDFCKKEKRIISDQASLRFKDLELKRLNQMPVDLSHDIGVDNDKYNKDN